MTLSMLWKVRYRRAQGMKILHPDWASEAYFFLAKTSAAQCEYLFIFKGCNTYHNTRWEKWLPKSGDLFERAMCHLTVNGAVELGKFYEKPAEKIISYMINGRYRFFSDSEKTNC